MTDAWIARWRGQSLDELTSRFEALTADDAGGWARSELGEDIPQMARFRFLRALWDELVGCVESATNDIEALTSTGTVTRERIEQALRPSLYVLGFNISYLLDEPDGTVDPVTMQPIHVDADGPRWQLIERSPDGALTGRDVGGLHESFLELAPGGEDGAAEDGWL